MSNQEEQRTLTVEDASLKDLVNVLVNLNQQIGKIETTVDESVKFANIVQVVSFVANALQYKIQQSASLQNEPSGITSGFKATTDTSGEVHATNGNVKVNNIRDARKERVAQVGVAGDDLTDLQTPF